MKSALIKESTIKKWLLNEEGLLKGWGLAGKQWGMPIAEAGLYALTHGIIGLHPSRRHRQ